MAATMTMDSSRQHHFSSSSHLPYDNSSSSSAHHSTSTTNNNNMHYSHPGPQFTAPVWASQNPSSAPLYASMAQAQHSSDNLPRPGFAKQSAGLPGYPSMLNTQSQPALNYAAPPPNYHEQQQQQQQQQPETGYAAAPTVPQQYTSSSPSHYNMSGYGSSLQPPAQIRRPSLQPGSLPPAVLPPSSTFGDPLDLSRGSLLPHAADITPRNVYGAPERYADSYGFPAPPSTHSSISAASSGYPYYAGSVDSSATDYSSADSIDSYHSRLPRLAGPMLPPAPATMMGSFNSKTTSNAQKKHKCKVCDKRFTRPSSLQTHMYSHTGEKPFACEYAGCGRQFSVVSNLRRHRKVHKSAGELSDLESSVSVSHSEHDASPKSTESWIKHDHDA